MKKLLIASTIGLLLVLTACDNETIEDRTSACRIHLETERPIRDRAGFDITLPDEINRIVSLAPSMTVMLSDLGLEACIVAMDTHSGLMFDHLDVPTFDVLHPEIESIIVLNPDLVLASTLSMMGDVSTDPFERLSDLGIAVAYLPTSDTILDIQADLRFIAHVTGEIARGEALIDEMVQEITEIVTLIDNSVEMPTVYFEISPAPHLFSFGAGVFLHEMIELIGAQNMLGDLSGWTSVEPESIVALNPDVIFTNVDFIDDAVGELLSRPGFEGVDAVINERVYAIDNHYTAIPTHRITQGLRAMAKALWHHE
ncbi:MAG: ABC transporter substrate-binding protein [Defluviitaleaceae bacterium]|nr:ABC transporter substrate-binding protein [Defluviitaleaceae bacterium]